jgi:hypothetical protein
LHECVYIFGVRSDTRVEGVDQRQAAVAGQASGLDQQYPWADEARGS